MVTQKKAVKFLGQKLLLLNYRTQVIDKLTHRLNVIILIVKYNIYRQRCKDQGPPTFLSIKTDLENYYCSEEYMYNRTGDGESFVKRWGLFQNLFE